MSQNDDLISRQAAIDAVRELYIQSPKINNDIVYDTAIDQAHDALVNLPSAQPYTDEEIQVMQDLEQAQLDKAYELGWKEGREALRQAAIDAIEILLEQSEDDEHDKTWNNAIRGSMNAIKHHVPSAQPQRTGRWIDGKCNKCGTHAPYWAMASTYYCSEYCPHCGAYMVIEEEM